MLHYHIQTHYQSPGFEPVSLVVYLVVYRRASNVFEYGELIAVGIEPTFLAIYQIIYRSRLAIRPGSNQLLLRTTTIRCEFLRLITPEYGWSVVTDMLPYLKTLPKFRSLLGRINVVVRTTTYTFVVVHLNMNSTSYSQDFVKTYH